MHVQSCVFANYTYCFPSFLSPSPLIVRSFKITTATVKKTSLKSEVALLETVSRFFHLVQFVKSWQFFLELTEF